MNVTFEERQLLNALSKELFGSPSRWRKVLDRGYGKAPELTSKGKIKKPGVITYFTCHEELYDYMLEIKAARAKEKEALKNEAGK